MKSIESAVTWMKEASEKCSHGEVVLTLVIHNHEIKRIHKGVIEKIEGKDQ